MSSRYSFTSPVTFVFVILVGIVGIRSIQYPPSEWYLHNDFAHYYVEAALIGAGENPYLADLGPVYQKYGFINKPKIVMATNPPALSLFLVPFTNFDPRVSFLLWTVLNILSLFGSVILTVYLLGLTLKAREFLLVFLAIGVTFPLIGHIELGQAQLFTLLLVVLGASCFIDQSTESKDQGSGSVALGSIIWGFASSFKLFTWPLIFLAFRIGRIRGVLYFVLGFIILNLPILILFGPGIFNDYLSKAIPYIQDTTLIFNGSNSLTGAVINTLRTVGSSIDYSTLLPLLNGISFLALLVILILEGWVSRRLRTDIILSCSFYLVASTLFSPTSWYHYLVLGFFALVIILRYSQFFLPEGLHPFNLLLAYVLLGLSQGRVEPSTMEWSLITSWWGVIAQVYLLFCLLKIQALSSHKLS